MYVIVCVMCNSLGCQKMTMVKIEASCFLSSCDVVVLDVYLFVDEPGVKRSPALLHVPTVDFIGYCLGLKRSQEKPSGLSYIIGCEIGSSLHRCHIDLAWNGWPVLCLTCRRQRKMTKMDPGVFWQLSWNCFFLCEQVTPITPNGCSVVRHSFGIWDSQHLCLLISSAVVFWQDYPAEQAWILNAFDVKFAEQELLGWCLPAWSELVFQAPVGIGK